jgi:hypothetical protein
VNQDNLELWKIEQAAVFIRKSVRWIQYAMKIPPEEIGSIPYCKMGKTPLFIADKIREWVARGCSPAAAIR